jgi:hypothetical protein
MELTDIYRIFLPKPTESSAVHETFSKIDHILGHKASLTNTTKLK